jgi:agmatine/peptidylarginine deiminase
MNLEINDGKATLNVKNERILNNMQSETETKAHIQYSVDNENINTHIDELFTYVNQDPVIFTSHSDIDGLNTIKFHMLDANAFSYPMAGFL